MQHVALEHCLRREMPSAETSQSRSVESCSGSAGCLLTSPSADLLLPCLSAVGT